MPGGCDEDLHVLAIEGDDFIAIRRKQRQRCIDDVRRPGRREQFTGRPSEALVEGPDLDSSQRRHQPGLSRSSSPDLTDDASMGDRKLPQLRHRLESGPHRSFVAIKRNQRPCVEDERHADVAARRRPPPRMTTASSRSDLRRTASSSGVISPNSAS